MNKRLSMLGLARRAGKLKCGFDAAVEAIRSGEAKGATAASDISAKTFSNLKFEAERRGIQAVRIEETTEAVSRAIGKKAGVVAVCDEGFFKVICDSQANRISAERVRMDSAEGDANE